MSFNGTATQTYSRTTPNDGLLLQAEFTRLYGNDKYLKAAADAAAAAISALEGKLAGSPEGSYATIAARLAVLEKYNQVGKIDAFDFYQPISADRPWLPLSNPDAVLSVDNYLDLVPYYRTTKKVIYMPGTGSAKSQFDITHYTRASNVVTITLANTTAELALIAAIAEENLVHGSFSSWLPFTLPAAIGSGSDVPAGDYAITALNAGARQISFNHTGSNIGSTSVTAVGEIWPHRIPGSTTTARHYQIKGRTLVSINDEDGDVIIGLRRRDRLQGHYHRNDIGTIAAAGGPSMGAASMAFCNNITDTSLIAIREATTDGSNGSPRSGKTTDPRALGVVFAVWVGRYVAP